MIIHITFWPVWWALFLLWVFGAGRVFFRGTPDLGHAFAWAGGLLLLAGIAIGRLVA